ncbi:MAG: hypothetical protein EXR77_18975 [Myxococcales bacterium]|nr:hypothetical protein [Myxococcales bacterium]
MKGWLALFVATMGCQAAHTEPSSKLAQVEVIATGVPLDHGQLEVPPLSRSPRRLNADQLAASLPVVAGNDSKQQAITWTVKVGGKDVPAINEGGVGTTLGRPDYYQNTQESDDASPLYLKFVDDMARDVCAKMVAADLVQKNPMTRNLVRFSEFSVWNDKTAVARNLRYLTLRFLGRKVADTDVASIANLQDLYEKIAAAQAKDADRGKAAWQAVCVALLISPEFHVN